MEVNNIEVKAFEAISPHEGLRGRKFMRPPCVDARAGRRQMDMAVLEVKIYEATLCASRAARRKMEVNRLR